MSAAAKAALVTLLTTTFAGDTAVLVSYGVPGPMPMPDVIAITDTRTDEDGDEESFDLTIVVSCYVGGGDAAQAVATTRAYSLWASVRAAIYAAPTLSGTARVTALANEHRTAETVAFDAHQVPVGRLTEIVGTVTVWSGRLLLGSVRSAHNVP